MSSDLLFVKSTTGMVPANDEAHDWLRKKRLGASLLVDAKEMRNGAFFRKYMALLQMSYEYWADNAKTLEFKGKQVMPNFDRFRKDIIITAGFYYPVVNLKGEVRIEHESLKWASMTEERFTELYDRTITALIQQVFNGKICQAWTEAELRSVVAQIESFAA